MRFLLPLALLLLSKPVAAAEITLSDAPGCAIELNGVVTEGDFRRFSEIAEAADLVKSDPGFHTDNSDSALCLDSPGGVSEVGRDIMRFVHANGIATRVEADDSCFSVCALIFMAGRNFYREGDGVARLLDAKGTLGFHAPFVFGDPSRTYVAADLEATYSRATSAIADLIEFGASRSIFDARPRIPTSLIAKLLRKGPSEVYAVETVEDVAFRRRPSFLRLN
jgi:hypothetical protein